MMFELHFQCKPGKWEAFHLSSQGRRTSRLGYSTIPSAVPQLFVFHHGTGCQPPIWASELQSDVHAPGNMALRVDHTPEGGDQGQAVQMVGGGVKTPVTYCWCSIWAIGLYGEEPYLKLVFNWMEAREFMFSCALLFSEQSVADCL